MSSTPHRGDICDKWHRYCVDCGRKVHKNASECPSCDGTRWTRNKNEVEA